MSEVLSREEQEKLKKLGYIVDMVDKDEQKIESYNFAVPQYLTKSNIRLLNTVYDCFAKTFANKLTGILRTKVDVDVLSIKEMKYEDVVKNKREGFVLPIIEAKLKEEKEYSTDYFNLAFSNFAMYFIINKLLGGDDEPFNKDRRFTSLELNLIKSFIVSSVIPIIEVSWAGYIDLITSCSEIVLMPELNNHVVLDTKVLNIEFELIILNNVENFEICMPIEFVKNIFNNLGNKFLGLEDSEKIKQKKSLMLDHIKESDVEVKVILGKTKLELRDILSLQVGDVMMLDTFTDSLAQVVVKNNKWFLGKIGVCRERKSIKIVETL